MSGDFGEVSDRWSKVLRFDAHLWAMISYLSGRSSRIRLSNSVAGDGREGVKKYVPPLYGMAGRVLV